MEIRDIEIFLTLAEELHFGRTADRLHVTPARVSQAIKKQERRVGAALFLRTSRSVQLTPVGEQLRDDLTPVYRGLRESMERAQMAAQGVTGVLRVGMLPINGYDLRPYWEEFRKRHPRWELRIRNASFLDSFGALRRGEFDAMVLWLPVEEPDLTVGPEIFTEPRFLMTAADHPLAAHDPVSIEALADFSVLSGRTVEPAYWEHEFMPFETPRGRTVPRNPDSISTLDDIYTMVSSGEAVHTLGAHVTRYHGRPDIVYRPLSDAPPLRWGLVWHTESENELVRGLAAVVRDLGVAEL